jgi:hypothetical protein
MNNGKCPICDTRISDTDGADLDEEAEAIRSEQEAILEAEYDFAADDMCACKNENVEDHSVMEDNTDEKFK